MSTKSVVITGASKGIGRASALHMDKLGWRVFAGVRKEADAESLKNAASDRLTPIMIDVTKEETIVSAAEQVAQAVGDAGLHGLVNNAGIAVPAPLEFIPIDALRWQLEVNVIGQVAVTQKLIPQLRQAKGRIVNMSSIAGRVVLPINSPYHISKYALEAMNDALRLELAPWDIEVVAIEPGAIKTPIWETSLKTVERISQVMPDAVQKLYGEQIEKLRKAAEDSAAKAIPVEHVAEVIETALTTRRPRPRYPVGRDAKFVINFIAPLPARLKDRLILNG